MCALKILLFVLPACLFAVVFSGPVSQLDVFIARKELRRFFQEFDIGDFYIVRQGVIDNFVQNKVTGYLPAIHPDTQSLEMKMQSKSKLYYKLHLSTSDRSLMKTPSATIKMNGHVPRKARSFKIKFPCTRRKTGTAMLTIRMEFMSPSKKKHALSEFVIRLRRNCEKATEILAPTPAAASKINYVCPKKCDKENVRRRFCLSDFAIRARVEATSINKNGRTVHKMRVTRLYKRSQVQLAKKIDIEVRGRVMTCECEPLQIRKTYLILGKEQARTNTLFLDEYTYAIEWPRGGKKMAKLHKKRRSCPRRLGITWSSIEKV